MTKPKEKWQHFIIKNKKTGETKQFKIGPSPVLMSEIMTRMRKAHKEIGVPFSKNSDWVIEKAWEGF